MFVRRAGKAAALAVIVAVAGCGGDAAEPSAASAADPTRAPPSTAPAVPAPAEVGGLVVYASAYDVDETVERLRAALDSVGMVVATVDHAAGAASVGEQLRPTTLVIGGVPKAGTPLMLEQQRAAADLPQKYLTWQDENGAVFLGYNSVDYTAARAGVAPGSEALAAAESGSAAIARMASGNDAPLREGGGEVSSEVYLVERRSDTTVATSIARYEEAFAGKDLMLVGTVDHAAGAAAIDVSLRPTSTTFVGNPMVGTQLLQAAQTFGIDLPTRYLAWEDAQGVVHVGHPDIRALAERHGVRGVDEVLAMVEMATAAFTDIAAGR